MTGKASTDRCKSASIVSWLSARSTARPEAMPRWLTRSRRRTLVRPGTSIKVGICSASSSGSLRQRTTCDHWRRHATKRSCWRASSSKPWAKTVRLLRESTQRPSESIERRLVQRPVVEGRIDEHDLGRIARLGPSECRANGGAEIGARGDGDERFWSSFMSSLRRSRLVGASSTPAGAQPRGQQFAGLDGSVRATLRASSAAPVGEAARQCRIAPAARNDSPLMKMWRSS